MKGIYRFRFLSIILVLSYLLSACSGAAVPSQSDTPAGGGKAQSMEVSFTGTVEAVGSGTITVSGQTVALDAKTVVDPAVKVGDIVKVEAQVSETGAVLALKVESFSADDPTNVNANSNDTNTDTNTNTNTNTNANDNSNTSAGNDNINSSDNSAVSGGTEQEISGTVEALTAETVTINGVTYSFASFTEFKDAVFAGDNVKLHVIVNADGSLTVREIEKSAGRTGDDDNSNSNDDNSNDDNSNGNSNDDDDDDDDNSNGDSDDDDDDNSNDGNGNGS